MGCHFFLFLGWKIAGKSGQRAGCCQQPAPILNPDILAVKVLLFEKALVLIKIELTGHLPVGVIISLQAGCQKYNIYLFFLKVKFWRVIQSYIFNSKSTATRPNWLKIGLLQNCFCEFLSLFSFLSQTFFPREVLTKNLRHGFLAEDVKKWARDNLKCGRVSHFVFFVSGGSGT